MTASTLNTQKRLKCIFNWRVFISVRQRFPGLFFYLSVDPLDKLEDNVFIYSFINLLYLFLSFRLFFPLRPSSRAVLIHGPQILSPSVFVFFGRPWLSLLAYLAGTELSLILLLLSWNESFKMIFSSIWRQMTNLMLRNSFLSFFLTRGIFNLQNDQPIVRVIYLPFPDFSPINPLFLLDQQWCRITKPTFEILSFHFGNLEILQCY